jgi:hypothetical protein
MAQNVEVRADVTPFFDLRLDRHMADWEVLVAVGDKQHLACEIAHVTGMVDGLAVVSCGCTGRR